MPTSDELQLALMGLNDAWEKLAESPFDRMLWRIASETHWMLDEMMINLLDNE